MKHYPDYYIRKHKGAWYAYSVRALGCIGWAYSWRASLAIVCKRYGVEL